MKFTIEKKKLSAATTVLYNLASKSAITLIHGVLDKGRLSLAATVGRNTLCLLLECNSTDEGEFDVEGARLCPVIAELPDGEIAISVGETMIIDWASGKCQSGIDRYVKFPPEPKIGKDAESPIRSLSLSREDIGQILRGVSPATDDKDDLRPVMGGLFFEIEDNRVSIAGTDGQILLTRRVNTTTQRTGAFSFLVPKMSIKLLADVVPSDTDEVTLNCDGKVLSCKGEGFSLTALCIDSKFPAYRSIISDTGRRLTADRKELLAAVKRVMVMSSMKDDHDAITITLGEDGDQTMRLGAQNLISLSTVTETLPCKWDGGKVRLAFLAQKMMSALRSTESENITLLISVNNKPVMFLPDDEAALGVLMPVPVREIIEPKKTRAKKGRETSAS